MYRHMMALASGLVVLVIFHSWGLALFSLAFCLLWVNVAAVAPKWLSVSGTVQTDITLIRSKLVQRLQ